MSRTNIDQIETKERPVLLFIAGFGDNSSMFQGLFDTCLNDSCRLMPIDLPGFGAPKLAGETSLETLAEFVAETARKVDAKVIVAHSVASIIASLAAPKPGCPLTTIISLEGNITAEDAYFSGRAAKYDHPEEFRNAFMKRLDQMATNDPMIARYRQVVSEADPLALWQLGRDAHQFSARNTPGVILSEAARVTYFYNPDNCPKTTLRWLDEHPMERIVLEGASHWPSLDQPDMLAEKIGEVIKGFVSKS